MDARRAYQNHIRNSGSGTFLSGIPILELVQLFPSPFALWQIQDFVLGILRSPYLFSFDFTLRTIYKRFRRFWCLDDLSNVVYLKGGRADFRTTLFS